MKAPAGLVSAIAIVLIVLGAILIVISVISSFEPESGQWLFIFSGGANIALGVLLIRSSTVARTREGV